MLTYVINTSENKTFDSDQLFKLVGYNKICWMNCALNELEKCADEICEKQTSLSADDFRIAILIDFYGFDRVMNAYGENGYVEEKGVDLSLYFPFLEAYVADHLFAPIRKKELIIQERHVFYIQNGKHDDFNIVSNELQQLQYVLEPDEDSVTDVVTIKVPKSQIIEENEKKKEEEFVSKVLADEERALLRKKFDEMQAGFESLGEKELKKRAEADVLKRQAIVDELEERELNEENSAEVYVDVPRKCYAKFNLYCTPAISLSFEMSDYPYTNEKGLCFEDFCRAFKQREVQRKDIKRHYYYASFGSGIAKAALDNLSLSLYLIKMYEREEVLKENESVVIQRIDPEHLKTLLITAWNKICSARAIAINNGSQYYDIKDYASKEFTVDKEIAKEEDRADIYNKARKEAGSMSVDALYQAICTMAKEDSNHFSEKDKKELDDMMTEYLMKRDSTTEEADENEFNVVKEDCDMIPQCPSYNDYEQAIATKKERIAQVLQSAISVDYQEKDYEEAKKKADEAYKEYAFAKKSVGKAYFADIGLWLLSMVIIMVPFLAIKNFNFTIGVIFLLTAIMLTGIYVISFIIRFLPLAKKMRKEKARLKNAYIDCKIKQSEALFNYKHRYSEELVQIEHLRYDLRNLTKLYHYNIAKNRNVEQHRNMLEVVENQLSGMLNNLGVEPTVVRYKDLAQEFNVNKSYMSNENRIYKIFSIEAIENLFANRGN